VLPHCREVMGEENRVENLDQEVYCSLWEMLQVPVRDNVRVQSLADIETPDGVLNLLRFVLLWFAGRGLEVRPQRHVNHPKISRSEGSVTR